MVSEVGFARDELKYSRHSSHGGTDGCTNGEAGGTEPSDKVLDREAVSPVRGHGEKAAADGEVRDCPDGGAESHMTRVIPWP